MRRLSPGNVGLPLCPRHVVVRTLDRHEEREVIEPVRMVMTERLETIAQGNRRGRRKALEHCWPQCSAVCDDGLKIDGTVRECRAALAGGQQTICDEVVERDQQRVAGERRKALIRRIPVTGRPQRQDLPDALARGSEQVYELVSAVTEVANPVGSGKRCRVEKDATRARRHHSLCGYAQIPST